MSTVENAGYTPREERAQAFVPELLPPPLEVEDAEGPLSPKEQQYLKRAHMARDHHGNAQWMRGKALAAVFSRRLYRGEEGTRTRQEYLDDEWDGLSETAAYREIEEWPLAAQIAATFGRAVPSTHVQALLGVAGSLGIEPVAEAYTGLRRYGKTTRQRVTAGVVENLADFLGAGRALPAPSEPAAIGSGGEAHTKADEEAAPQPEPELDSLFSARQLPGPRKAAKKRRTKDAVEPSEVIPKSGNEGGWSMSEEQIDRLSKWIVTAAAGSGTSPDSVFETILELLAGTPTSKTSQG
ncbi:hypothetical protein [Streptomyces sp. NPDC058495]|uniref:hypothetical protein n=1 Tax=unclassified Streptomyces TaxID=2593676 RepID=UPI00364B9E20